MLCDEVYVKNHFRETEELVREIPSEDIAYWMLNHGYFPEQYILPPSFQVSNFTLQSQPYNKDLNKITKRQLISISHPKTILTSRIFSIQHPFNYHDIIFFLQENWDDVINHLFHKENKIYSYSFPISLTKKKEPGLSNLRSGRMIYEWLAMAERNLILDAKNYRFIARTDISNFYSSIYTHSIAWSLHGRENALEDHEYNLFGNKIDRLVQYANDGRTNGIPIGSVLSDLIAEIILSSIDRETSGELKDIDFLAVRFKDDYRFLCESESKAKQILKALSKNLSFYNLSINENKTSIQKLPDGLYRKHDRQYFPHSLKNKKPITFKCFEHTLLIALDIHRNNPGTSILEKFISECFIKDDSTQEKKLKITFSENNQKKIRQVKQVISLLFLVKRESEKLLCHVLSISEQLYINHRRDYSDLKPYLKSTIKNEIHMASKKDSIFETVWLIFFSRYLKLGINQNEINDLLKDAKITENKFYKSILNSQQEIFKDAQINFFKAPKYFKDNREFTLAKYLDIFNRENIE
ncbi:MAG: RNA-directed DNA polymerase [Xenococcaceae cyanobacterium MO_188.B29]|nr:RNA-directed DNA polymerase [Xenococcaceae cyanobacterium MO_188.B29]